MLKGKIFGENNTNVLCVDFGATMIASIINRCTQKCGLVTLDMFIYEKEVCEVSFELSRLMDMRVMPCLKNVILDKVPVFTDSEIRIGIDDNEYLLQVRKDELCTTTEFDQIYKRRLVYNGFTVGHFIKKYPKITS